MKLAEKNCQEPPVSVTAEEEIKNFLEELKDWRLEGKAITREFQFGNFKEAMEFVNKVAQLAESQKHHPDIFISYRKVKLTLSTHKVGGLSRNDFILAAKTDLLA